MQSDKPKRDIADFFKRYAQPAIPQKRASPNIENSDDNEATREAKIARKVPKTPSRTVSFKDVTPSSKSTIRRNIFSPNGSAALAIRSPKGTKSPLGVSSDSRQRTLFQTFSPPKTLKEPEPTTNPNISFTLSDTSERSQSVFKDGKVVAVLDSDDDTDSLISLSDLLGVPDRSRGQKYPPNVPTNESSFGSSQESVDNETERLSILAKFTRGRSDPVVGREKLREFNTKQKQLKFDLSGILDDHFGDIEVTEKISKARAESDSEDLEELGFKETDKKLLADIVLNGSEDVDAEDVSRVWSALERTEALAGEERFSFFTRRGMLDRRASIVPTELPVHAIPNDLWSPDDVQKRARMFLSGIMVEKATARRLDDGLLQWIFWEALREQESDIRQAYIQTLEAASPFWTRLHVSAGDIQRMFKDVGAVPEVLEDNNLVTPKHHLLQSEDMQSSAQLLATLDLLQAIIEDLDMSALSKLTSIMIRLCLDDTTMSNGKVSEKCEDVLTSLLTLANHDARWHVYIRMLDEGMRHVRDHVLQASLLSRIPASSSTATQLRKTLADVFLLGESVLDWKSMASNASLETLSKHVQKNEGFGITRKLNASPSEYATLTALISILDVAIGIGKWPTELYGGVRNAPTLVPFHVQQQDQLSDAAIRSFNASVDALADSIHTIFVSIKDTGASHMRRTETKDALQALEYRCLYSIRIGVRKKKHVFDVIREMGGVDSDSNSDAEFKNAAKIVGMDGNAFRERARAREAMDKFLSRVKSQKNEVVMNDANRIDLKDEDGQMSVNARSINEK